MSRLVGLLLLVFGVTCLLWFDAGVRARTEFQRAQAAQLRRELDEPRPPTPIVRRVSTRDVVGRIEIPRVGFSPVGLSPVAVQADHYATCKVSVGHLADTPFPWQSANAAFAGHRDTFFRPLRQVRKGDEIRFVSPEGRYRYRVTDLQITKPDNLA